MEDELERPNLEPIPTVETSRLGDPLTIQISAVTAAKIHQPELPFPLQLDERMAARNLFVRQGQLVGSGTPNGKGPLDWDASALKILQPRSFVRCSFCHDFARRLSLRLRRSIPIEPRLLLSSSLTIQAHRIGRANRIFGVRPARSVFFLFKDDGAGIAKELLWSVDVSDRYRVNDHDRYLPRPGEML